jgi:putative ABC transport system permease protein
VTRLPRLHLPTVWGRWRTDRGLLLLTGLVVALTTALTAAVAPAGERTADRAIAATVHDAGSRGAVVATMPEWYDDPRGKTRDPTTAVQVRQDADYARHVLPPELAAVVRPGITTITTPALQLLDAGPGRFLQLAYVETPDGVPAVSYTQGGAPRASVGARRAETGLGPGTDPWPVQVAVSDAVADALDLQVGDRLPARDERGRQVEVRVSGTFMAIRPDDQAWQVSTRMLQPAQGRSDGLPFTSAAALVSSESLPDLRLALPADAITHRVVFAPDPRLVRWSRSAALEQAVVSLQASGGLARGDISWDSLLGTVLDDAQARVVSARGQAQVLLVGLVTCALLVLVLAAQLLVRRRAGQLATVRQRGATLLDIGVELLLEAVAVAVLGALLGLGAVRLLAGSVGWGWSVPVVVVAAAAAPVLGAVAAGRATARQVPANRTTRRTAARAHRLRRLGIEAAVLAVATMSYVALRQRGVVGEGGADGDVAAASAPTWWAVAGTVVLLHLLPPALLRAVRISRRSAGGVMFVVAARLTQTATRALPVLVVSVAVALITLGVALAATEREGQSAAALTAVGGDARLDAEPDAALDEIARELDDAPGVQATAAARVEDGVQLSSPRGTEIVRLVVVDTDAFQRLLEASDLPDAPQLARLRATGVGPVPALLLGGDGGLREDPVLRWADSSVPIDVVGTAPDVNGSIDPVVVVHNEALAGEGVVAPPDTIWAVGPGAGEALDSVEERGVAVEAVVRQVDELDRRRDAPLPSALVRLAAASSALLLALAILGTALAAAADAPTRGESLGRLRALGIPDRDLRRVLRGELVLPVTAAALAGLGLGVGCAYAVLGSLSLQRLTGQPAPPAVVVPWWTVLAVVVLVCSALAVAALEWRRLRSRPLAELLRS